jgi:acyl carrier protein
MKKSHYIFLILFLLTLTAFWVAFDHQNHAGMSENAVQKAPAKMRVSQHSSDHATIDRIRMVAKRRLPNVDFQQREDVVFADIDPKIDELEVMELLLAVETEFEIDIPDRAISDLVGISHRRDLRRHLSLSLIAQLLREVEPSEDR